MSIPTSFDCFDAEGDQHQEETFLQARDQDVIFGRGGKSYSHPGNRLFRRLIFHHKDLYESMKKASHRQFLARSIVEAIRRSGTNFIRKETLSSSSSQEVWKTVSVKEACIKTSQALRDANVRTKRCPKAKIETSQVNVVAMDDDHSINSSRPVVSPCDISTQTVKNNDTLPPAPLMKPSAIVSEGDGDLSEIDHIDLETIQTLVRSLGANTHLQECISTPARQHTLQRSSFSHLSFTSQCEQRKMHHHQQQLPNSECRNDSRLSFSVRDWFTVEATSDKELPPGANKPHEQFRPGHCSTTRWSITSTSMLESGLFSADFDFDDFDMDATAFS